MDVAVLTVLVFNGGSTGWKIAAYEDVGPTDAPVKAASYEVEFSWRGDVDGDVRSAIAAAFASRKRLTAGDSPETCGAVMSM